jgi:uncharacterized protein (TIGR02118 family)
MIRVFVMLVKPPELNWEEFARYWRETHAQHALRLPGLRRYVQHHFQPGSLSGEPPCHGIAELWFDDEAAMRAAFESPEGQASLADNPRFLVDERTKLAIVDSIEFPVP